MLKEMVSECVRVCMDCMTLIGTEVLCSRSQDSFASVSAWCAYRLSCM